MSTIRGVDSFERKLRTAFQTFAAEDMRRVSEVRLLLEARREILFCDVAADGLDLARGLAEMLDTLLATYHDADGNGQGLAVVALGGYGRGEVNPHSDVDVMVLIPDGAEERADAFAGPLLAFLWDLGLTVGHSARSLDQCREWMRKDLPSATALIEARFIAGSRALFRRFRDHVTGPWLEANGPDFIDKKIEEARARHRFYGDSPRLLTPNVKESPGGLRDMHVAGWIATALSGRRDFEVFREAGLLDPGESAELLRCYSEIHGVRNMLHLLADGRQDVLDPWARKEAAAGLGFTDGGGFAAWERFMRFYYEAALRLNRFLERVIRFASDRPTPVPARTVDLPGSPGEALALLADLVRRGETAGPDLEDAIRPLVPQVEPDVRADPEAARSFLAILSRPGAGGVLRTLDRAGFLGEYLPEFGRLSCLVREDPVHQYTVDEHTLRAVEELDSLAAEDHPRREEMARVERPDLLRLALLMHDVGKARAGSHVDTAVAMVPDVTARLSLTETEAAEIRFLVRHHSLMTSLADHRVPGEAAAALAEAVPHRDRLRALYLLTLADVGAVGRGTLTGWREAQLGKLYSDAMAMLSPGSRRPLVEQVLEQAGPERESEAREHLDAMGERYALEVDASRVLLHLDLVARLAAEPAALTCVPGDGYEEVWIAVADAPGRLADLAGVLTLRELDIRAAHLYTRRDGVAVDGFIVTDYDDAPADPDARWQGVADDIVALLADGGDLAERMDRHRARFRPGVDDAGGPPTGVAWRERTSTRFAAIEVTGRDRPGLLYDLARIFAGHGLSIHHAIAATKGAVVTDTFYVAMTAGERPARRDHGPLLADLGAVVSGEARTA
ncbi:MAG: ACT domain-containing protein [Planctomycetota bacterium]